MKVKTKLEAKELVRMTIEETNNCYPINSEWTPIMSVRKQLNYILESLDFLNDRSRLNEINIGLYAVREFEVLHEKLANLIYKIVEIIALMKKGKL